MDKFNPHSPDCKLSKDHQVCSKCQQVRPLAEFEVSETVKTGFANIQGNPDGSTNSVVIPTAQPTIKTIVHNNDKSSRNQALDEVIKAVHGCEYPCSDLQGEPAIEIDEAIKAIEGLKL